MKFRCIGGALWDAWDGDYILRAAMAVKKTENANRANHSNIAMESSAKAEIKSEVLDDTTWDEARLQEAQKKLKEMYIQVGLSATTAHAFKYLTDSTATRATHNYTQAYRATHNSSTFSYVSQEAASSSTYFQVAPLTDNSHSNCPEICILNDSEDCKHRGLKISSAGHER